MRMKRKPRDHTAMFITFEGIEGSGKTTQIKRVHSLLTAQGCNAVMTREPGGTLIGEKIRSILLDPESRDMDPLAELMLYFADRAQHLGMKIRKSLSKGTWVLCDRYFDATLAYQGYARGLNIQLIERLHQLVFDAFKPDVTLLLDLPPQTGLDRAWRQIKNGTRTGKETRFEEEALRFHEKVRHGYLSLARQEPHRFKIIDASQAPDLVSEDILAVLTPFIRPRR
jgi:dTMP kinase